MSDWSFEAAQALRDTAELFDPQGHEHVDIVVGIIAAANLHTPTAEDGRELAEAAMRQLCHHLALNGDTAAALTSWAAGLTREQIAASLRAGGEVSSERTLTEYAIRYTQLAQQVLTGRLFGRRTRFKLTPRRHAAEALARMRAWQERSPVCPEVDAVIVTRTVTVGEWVEQQADIERTSP